MSYFLQNFLPTRFTSKDRLQSCFKDCSGLPFDCHHLLTSIPFCQLQHRRVHNCHNYHSCSPSAQSANLIELCYLVDNKVPGLNQILSLSSHKAVDKYKIFSLTICGSLRYHSCTKCPKMIQKRHNCYPWPLNNPATTPRPPESWQWSGEVLCNTVSLIWFL